MWFGDLVTMRWWDDLWLNESFAEWACYHAEAEATEFTDAWTGFTNARKQTGYRQDQLPSTHPIAADNLDLEAVEVNFDMITYAKGASVLKQLVAWVGLDAVPGRAAAVLPATTPTATPSSPTCSTALEKASGRELDSWAQEWLQTAGVNTLAPGVRARRRRRATRRSPSARPRTRLRRRCAGTGSASASTTTQPTARSCGATRRGRRRGRAHRDPRAGRREAARPAAAQRRRPHLRQDPPRRALAGHRGRRPRPAATTRSRARCSGAPRGT